MICLSKINIGDEFSEFNIEVKGPERGLSAQYYFDVVGKKSKREIKKGEYLLNDDLETAN